MSNQTLSYAMLRMITGLNVLMHSLTRLFDLSVFKKQIIHDFQNTILHESLLNIFSLTLPFLELIVGILLILGLFTKQTLVVASLLIAVLIFGSSLAGNWTAVGLQMIYVLIYYVLLLNRDHNQFSLDHKFFPKG